MDSTLKLRIRLYLKTLGMVGLLTNAIIIMIAFGIAYLQPEKAVLVTINQFGEANLELVGLIVMLPLMILVFVDYIRYVGEMLWLIR